MYRDISINNVFLDLEFEFRFFDFGIVKLLVSGLFNWIIVVGFYGYMVLGEFLFFNFRRRRKLLFIVFLDLVNG